MEGGGGICRAKSAIWDAPKPQLVVVKFLKSICLNFEMYLYKFRNVFVQILNCIFARDGGRRGHLQSEVSNLGCTRVTISICQNFEQYLSKF